MYCSRVFPQDTVSAASSATAITGVDGRRVMLGSEDSLNGAENLARILRALEVRIDFDGGRQRLTREPGLARLRVGQAQMIMARRGARFPFDAGLEPRNRETRLAPFVVDPSQRVVDVGPLRPSPFRLLGELQRDVEFAAVFRVQPGKVVDGVGVGGVELVRFLELPLASANRLSA